MDARGVRGPGGARRPAGVTLALDASLAARFAAIALDNVVREFPNKLDHVCASDADVCHPRELHPAFYGSFDWHSSVHMHWLLARLHRLHPALPRRREIEARFGTHFAASSMAGELAYLARAESATFERPYGWAWLLKLAAELLCGDDDVRRAWSNQLAPLAHAFSTRFTRFLSKAGLPVRSGVHANSAFALAFALDYAHAAGDAALAAVCDSAARAWYSTDRDYPAAWEPSGTDFLSPALTEADLMRRVLAPSEFGAWLASFLTGFAHGEPSSLFTPVVPADRGDGQLVHLDGLNLSRAWCLSGIEAALPDDDPRRAVARSSAQAHLCAGMSGVANADYVASHWLPSFATLALSGP